MVQLQDRRFEVAAATFDRALAVNPNDKRVLTHRACAATPQAVQSQTLSPSISFATAAATSFRGREPTSDSTFEAKAQIASRVSGRRP